MAMLGGECSSCCGDLSLCSSTRTKARITIFGLPTECGVSPTDVRSFATNNYSYPLFKRIDTDSQVCVYYSWIHLSDNRFNSLASGYSTQISLDVTNNLLIYTQFATSVHFRPAAGQSFSTFPFDGVLVPEYMSVYDPRSCVGGDFDNVRVVIDDGVPGYVPFECPGSTSAIPFRGLSQSCTSGIDTLPSGTDTTVGNTRTVVDVLPGSHCAPSDAGYHATQTTTYVDTGTSTTVTQSTSVPDLNLSVTIDGPDIARPQSWGQPGLPPLLSYSQLSGTYAAKYKYGNPGFWLPFAPGSGMTFYGPNGAVWGYSGETLTTYEGWVVNYTSPQLSQRNNRSVRMLMHVTPLKDRVTVSPPNGSVSTVQCGHDTLSYQVLLSLFYEGSIVEMSLQHSTPCVQRVCRGLPVLNIDQTVTCRVYIGGGITPSYVEGPVRVRVSSQ
jgi:hypothetical protein